MVYHLMSEEDVERILRNRWVSVAADSEVLTFGEGAPHPRGYGNNARVLGVYAREKKKVIGLEEAIRKMTSLPARHFRLDGRGLIQEGKAADLALFDPQAVRDAATFEKPHAYARGFSLYGGQRGGGDRPGASDRREAGAGADAFQAVIAAQG